MLPAAPGKIDYTFSVFGEGVQQDDATIRRIQLGPQTCSQPIAFPTQETRFDCVVSAPTEWTTDTVYYIIFTRGLETDTEARSFLRP